MLPNAENPPPLTISLSLYRTPHTPKTSFVPFPLQLSSLRTRLTNSPTPRGPIIVHSTIAQVTIRKISESPVDEEPKVPLLSAMAEIRKPISPRATMAMPRIEAG